MKHNYPDLIQKNNLVDNLDELVSETKILYQQQITYGTRRAYESDWNLFVTWCSNNNFIAEHATSSIIALFLTYEFKENNTNPSTINRRLAAIKFWYKSHNHKSPTDDDVNLHPNGTTDLHSNGATSYHKILPSNN